MTGGPTLLVPALGGTAADLRPYARLLAGETIHVDPHPGAGPPGFHAVAERIDAAADRSGATRILASSFGASAVLHSLVQHPHRYSHAVLLVPFAFDRPRLDRWGYLTALADAAAAAAEPDLIRQLLDDLPVEVRTQRAARWWAASTARQFLLPEVGRVLRWLPAHAPVTSATVADPTAKPVDTSILVIAQPADPNHPVEIALRIARAFPASRAVVLPQPGAIWTRRQDVARLVADFLDGEPLSRGGVPARRRTRRSPVVPGRARPASPSGA